jgi:drug/metabolite transporter (DMT)-like permease
LVTGNHSNHSFSRYGAIVALVSAALFGASTPLAKTLLGQVSPWLLAGLLYLGAGTGLAIVFFVRRFGHPSSEAPLRRSDWPWLAAVTLAGGVVGPVFLMVGLSTTPASTSALLLNLEGLFTLTIAWTVFRENVDRRIVLGAGAILAGALLLSWDRGGLLSVTWGMLWIVAACLAWAIDNNLTRKLSSADPVQITIIKGLAAGTVNIALATMLGTSWPDVPAAIGAALVGFFGYGVSLVLFVLALRHVGTARTGAYFSSAPFIGAAIAVILLKEPVTSELIAATLLMGLGLYLHLAERHEHEHEHAELDHEHRHVHDEHHRHTHRPNDSPGEPHAHAHFHARLRHGHRHYPDLHHRHPH